MLKLKHFLLLLAITTLAGCGTATPEPPAVSLRASPPVAAIYYYPVDVRLDWSSARATRVLDSNFDTGGLVTGSRVVWVRRATTYHITVEGPGGKTTSSILVWAMVR